MPSSLPIARDDSANRLQGLFPAREFRAHANVISGTSPFVASSAEVTASISSIETPGPRSRRKSPVSVGSITAISVTMRLTRRKAVRGRLHSGTILALPLAVWVLCCRLVQHGPAAQLAGLSPTGTRGHLASASRCRLRFQSGRLSSWPITVQLSHRDWYRNRDQTNFSPESRNTSGGV